MWLYIYLYIFHLLKQSHFSWDFVLKNSTLYFIERFPFLPSTQTFGSNSVEQKGEKGEGRPESPSFSFSSQVLGQGREIIKWSTHKERTRIIFYKILIVFRKVVMCFFLLTYCIFVCMFFFVLINVWIGISWTLSTWILKRSVEGPWCFSRFQVQGLPVPLLH